jgi:hypothetical protein
MIPLLGGVLLGIVSALAGAIFAQWSNDPAEFMRITRDHWREVFEIMLDQVEPFQPDDWQAERRAEREARHEKPKRVSLENEPYTDDEIITLADWQEKRKNNG